MLKKTAGLFTTALVLLIVTGCPSFNTEESVNGISVFLNGINKTTGVTIEKGQTVTLKVETGINPDKVSIVWENEGTDKEKIDILNTGVGPECKIKGIDTGNADITVKAWRSGEQPKIISLPVTVVDAVVTAVNIIGEPIICAGEKRFLEAEIIPAWANFPVNWSAAPDPGGSVSLEEISPGVWTIEGVTAGIVALTAGAGSYTMPEPITFTIAVPESLTGLAIYIDGTDVTNGTVNVGVFEEKFLSARFEPSGAFTFFEWESDRPENVTVDSSGVIKGMTANGEATITVSASGLNVSVDVKVANPVSGVRIKYDNSDELQVTNIIWLYPDDFVELKAELMPAGIDGDIYWTGGEGAVQLTPGADGEACTITGLIADIFDSPPIILRVSARNNDNGAKPAAAVLQVKVIEQEPIWAWDRARDADDNQNLKLYGETPGNGASGDGKGIPASEDSPANNPTYNTAWKINGRGEYAERMINNLKRTCVPYTTKGLNMNSANPPEGIGGSNSTSLILGSNCNTNTTTNTTNPAGELVLGEHVPGIFDFSGVNVPIRVSVDFEVISSNGRQLMISINNNYTASLQCQLGNFSRLALRAINEAKGTKITYSTYLDAKGLISDQVTGYQTLAESLIAIVVMSGGANIYLSGVRIEYGE